jgi:hypothetical protein
LKTKNRTGGRAMNRIPFFGKKKLPTLTTEQIAAEKEAREKEVEKVRGRIVNLAAELSGYMMPGVSIIVNIETGKIISPTVTGTQANNAVIVITKPAVIETLSARISARPEPDNGKGTV